MREKGRVSLPATALILICCPKIIVKITPFHFPKCPHVDGDLLDRPRYRGSLHGTPKIISAVEGRKEASLY